MEKEWTVFRYEGRGRCRVMGRLVATEKAIQEAIAQTAGGRAGKCVCSPCAVGTNLAR